MPVPHRLLRTSSHVLLMLVTFTALLATSRSAIAQNGTTTPLQLFRNYFVTGDYVVGGVGLRGLGVNGYATGTITIPDPNSVPATGVPAGADIVAAFLYWETVESSQTSFAGQQGFFNGYAISGTVLGNPNAPVSWSSGGCSGSSNGSKTMRTYRADVRPYLQLDANGKFVGNASYRVSLVDSGSNGGGAPLTLGASLVLIYRVLSPAVPLNAVVLYDGAYAPSNTSSTMTQPVTGFYQAASPAPVAKLTHIVGNGQTNKSEAVSLNAVSLPSLYANLPPFPGYYNGSWDNPTWLPNSYGSAVLANDSSETTSVMPSSTNSGCVSWGAIILSTTVQDTDNDALLDVWEQSQGYTDAVSGYWVPLPGANPTVPDIFVEIDYLSNLVGSATSDPPHSHLPKQAALDTVGKAFAAHNINIHFDLGVNRSGQNIYPGDPYVISYPVPVPVGASAYSGAGGNVIAESVVVCNDTTTTLCPFPGRPAVAWKGGFDYVQSQTSLGNFEPGRNQSYHYMLWGHSLGLPQSYWSAWAATASTTANPLAGLVSVSVNSGTATITLQSPPNFINPGSVAGVNRITITGALNQTSLNGTYLYNVTSQGPDAINPNVTDTVLTITTSGVANGTYNYGNEPGLALAYAGPVSSSGHSDIAGGDSAVTFGLWTADDPSGCQPDPSIPLSTGQVYCSNEVGSVQAQAGTLMHELGHTLALTHGGTYYSNPQNNPPSPPTYGSNCKPDYLSVMNYLFQIRGFPDGGTDYSAQTFANLNETMLNESVGIGSDLFTGLPAVHYTRWYAPPNSIDTRIQNTTGGRYATKHCDGTPMGPNEPPAVRVEGNSYSSAIDWNNDLMVPDAVSPQDVNFSGTVGDSPFVGFNDWIPSNNNMPEIGLDLRQMDTRLNVFGLSSGGIAFAGGGIAFGGGGIAFGGGGIAFGGGGIDFGGGGIAFGGGGIAFGGGGIAFGGGGTDQDFDTANSTADASTGLTAVPYPQNTHYVLLTWTAPGFGQIRKYNVWRATGSFLTAAAVTANYSLFSNVGTVSGAPPATMFIDKTAKNKTTYTYFVTDVNKQGVQSGASAPSIITVNY